MNEETYDTIKIVLQAMGYDDIDSLPRDQVLEIARASNIDIPMDDIPRDETDPQLAGIADGNELDNAFMEESNDADEEEEEDHENPMEEDSHDEVISSFCSITGSDPEQARHMLEAFSWDLEGAISVFMETNAADSGGDFMPRPARQKMPGFGNPLNDVSSFPPPRVPLGPLRTSGIHQQHVDSVIQNMMRSQNATGDSEDEDGAATNNDPTRDAFLEAMRDQMHQAFGGGVGGRGNINYGGMFGGMGDDDEPPSRRQDEYDEHGVRRPDAVRRSRLVSGGGGYFHRGGDDGEEDERLSGLRRAEDPSVEWMFPPPRHLSSQQSFDKVKSVAQKEQRWLLVNIQSHEHFSSHRLNRDTWTHDTIQEILRTTFMFWQRGHTTQDAALYMRLHRVDADNDLPHIGVIDPRTGAKLLTLSGFIAPDELCLKLMDFADRNPLDGSRVSLGGSQKPSGGNTPSTAGGPGDHGGSSSSSAGVSPPLPPGSAVATSDTSSPYTYPSSAYMSDAGSIASSAHGHSPPSLTTSGASGTSGAQSLGIADVPPIDLPDFGSVPDEPADGVKVSIKLSNGKGYARKYAKDTLVRCLFAVAKAQDPELVRARFGFDLVQRFPPTNLLTCLDKTIEECNLGGAQVLVSIKSDV